MKAMVTGSCGFIGSNLMSNESFRAYFPHVWPVDPAASSDPMTVAEALDDAPLYGGLQPDAIVMLSGIAGGAAPPGDCFEANVADAMRLVAYSARHGARLVLISSGAAGRGAQGVYPGSKRAMEEICIPAAAELGVELTVLRLGHVYGPRCDGKQGLIPGWVRALYAGEPIILHGRGASCRDFVYVEDVCEAIAIAAAEGAPGPGPWYIGGTVSPLYEIVKLLYAASSLDSGYVLENVPARRRSIDVQQVRAWKRQTAEGWVEIPGTGLRPGLRKTVEWFEVQADGR